MLFLYIYLLLPTAALDEVMYTKILLNNHLNVNMLMRARVGYLNYLFSNCLTSNQFIYSSVLLITSIVTELMSSLCRLLCDTMIQPFFDYVCNAQYPNLNKNLKTYLQAAQKKYIRFCLKLGDRTSIKINEFEKITWLPNQSIYTFFHINFMTIMLQVI